VGLIPLLWLSERASARQTVWFWAIAGFVASAGGLWWLVPTIDGYLHQGAVASTLISLVVWAYHALTPALAGFLYALIRPLRGRTMAAVLAWVSATVLTWPIIPFSFASMMVSTPLLLQTADLFGVASVDAITVCCGASLFGVMVEPHRRRQHCAWLTAAASAMLVYGIIRVRTLESTMAHSPSLKIGLVQWMFGTSETLEESHALQRSAAQASQKLVEQGADLVVWSESAIALGATTGSLPILPTRIPPIGAPWIFGASVLDESQGTLHNAALWASDQNRVFDRYHKQVLFPLGEYMPFGTLVPWLKRWFPRELETTAGQQPATMSAPVRPHRVGLMICYEDLVPWVSLASAGPDVGLWITLSDDSWFGTSNAVFAHAALATVRAIELRRAIVRSTSRGVSGRVLPTGVQVSLPLHQRTSALIEAPLLNGSTLRVWWGQWPERLVALTTAALALWSLWRRSIRRHTRAHFRTPIQRPIW
jgi:apolipoprotein N-acyltransferase